MTTKKIPMRMCLGCREMKPKRELIRIVKSKDGEIQIDTTGRLNGRGAYACNCLECLKKIRRANALSHAFAEKVDPQIYDKLEAELGKGEE